MSSTTPPLPYPPVTRARRKPRRVLVRDVALGGDAPIPVQTMVKVPTTDYDSVMREIEATVAIEPEALPLREQNILKELNCWEDACALAPFHCDINRVSVPNEGSA